MMLQKDLPEDFERDAVESHTVRDFAQAVFHSIGMDIQ
jgi:GDP-D-mannose dehydratase